MGRRKRKIKIKSYFRKKEKLVRVKYPMQRILQVILDLNRMIRLLSNAERKSMDQM